MYTPEKDQEAQPNLLENQANLPIGKNAFFICPECQENIPHIKGLSINDRGLCDINIKCFCGAKGEMNLSSYINDIKNIENKNKELQCCDLKFHPQKESYIFCLNCKKNLCKSCSQVHYELLPQHKLIFFKPKLSNTCTSHLLQLISFCDSCKISLCEKCASAHMNHTIINLSELKSLVKKKNIKYIVDYDSDPFFAKLEKQKENINQLISRSTEIKSPAVIETEYDKAKKTVKAQMELIDLLLYSNELDPNNIIILSNLKNINVFPLEYNLENSQPVQFIVFDYLSYLSKCTYIDFQPKYEKEDLLRHFYPKKLEKTEKEFQYSISRMFTYNGVYYGETKNSKIEGNGILLIKKGNNCKIEGVWENGYIENGTITYSNNTIYKGEIKELLPNGKGELISSVGTYQGMFVDGTKEGTGFMEYSDATDNNNLIKSYDGSWENDLYNGEGTLVYKNGDIYEGSFVNGKKDGKGTITYSNDKNILKYEGEWKNDLKNGIGRLYFKDMNIFEGQWINDKEEKNGTIIYCNGDIYKGKLLNFIPNGKGEKIYSDHSKFVGTFDKGKREGEGNFFYPNGSYYQGTWTNDKYNSRCLIF